MTYRIAICLPSQTRTAIMMMYEDMKGEADLVAPSYWMEVRIGKLRRRSVVRQFVLPGFIFVRDEVHELARVDVDSRVPARWMRGADGGPAICRRAELIPLNDVALARQRAFQRLETASEALPVPVLRGRVEVTAGPFQGLLGKVEESCPLTGEHRIRPLTGNIGSINISAFLLRECTVVSPELPSHMRETRLSGCAS